MAAGAGALHLRLGGPARYQGHHKRRCGLGIGPRPRGTDIRRALHLLWRALAWWVVALFLCELAGA
jgi:adenosylcobinamide-phosphate synthase